MSRPERVAVAELLARKASFDLAAARTLASEPEQADDVVGFHVQQAVEKSLKAILAVRGFEVPRTHDLTYLVELAGDAGIEVPLSLDDADRLTPWAVTTRYDDIADGLDRDVAVTLAQIAVDWASSAIADA